MDFEWMKPAQISAKRQVSDFYSSCKNQQPEGKLKSVLLHNISDHFKLE